MISVSYKNTTTHQNQTQMEHSDLNKTEPKCLPFFDFSHLQPRPNLLSIEIHDIVIGFDFENDSVYLILDFVASF